MLSDINSTTPFRLPGNLLYKTDDEWGEICVFEEDNQRTLTFGSIFEQSCLDIIRPHQPVHPYAQAVISAALLCNTNRVLLLGLGAGVVLHALNYLYPDARLHAVELRQAVFNIAKQYFQLERITNLKLTREDAFQFIKNAQNKNSQPNNLIISDLYLANGMDHRQLTVDFLEDCKSILSSDGWLVCNLHCINGLSYPFIQQVGKIFTSTYILPQSSGNIILYASNSNRAENTQSLSDKALLYQKELGFDPLQYLNAMTRFS